MSVESRIDQLEKVVSPNDYKNVRYSLPYFADMSADAFMWCVDMLEAGEIQELREFFRWFRDEYYSHWDIIDDRQLDFAVYWLEKHKDSFCANRYRVQLTFRDEWKRDDYNQTYIDWFEARQGEQNDSKETS